MGELTAESRRVLRGFGLGDGLSEADLLAIEAAAVRDALTGLRVDVIGLPVFDNGMNAPDVSRAAVLSLIAAALPAEPGAGE